MNTQPLQALAEQTAPKATYVAAGTVAGAGAWGVHEWAIAVGMAIAVLTYVTGLVFQLRRDRRERDRLDVYKREHGDD